MEPNSMHCPDPKAMTIRVTCKDFDSDKTFGAQGQDPPNGVRLSTIISAATSVAVIGVVCGVHGDKTWAQSVDSESKKTWRSIRIFHMS